MPSETETYKISRFEKQESTGRRFVCVTSKVKPVKVERFFDEFVTEEDLADMIADLRIKEDKYVEPDKYVGITQESLDELNIDEELVEAKKKEKEEEQKAKEQEVEGVDEE